jgi:hypothetical protein
MAQQPVAPAVVAPVPPVSEDPKTTEDPEKPKSPIAKFLASFRKNRKKKKEEEDKSKGKPADTGPPHSDVPGVKGATDVGEVPSGSGTLRAGDWTGFQQGKPSKEDEDDG